MLPYAERRTRLPMSKHSTETPAYLSESHVRKILKRPMGHLTKKKKKKIAQKFHI